MVFLVLRVVSGAKTLKPWFGCALSDTSTFLDVHAEFSSGNLDKGRPVPEEFNTAVPRVSVQKSPSELAVDVQPNLPVGDVVSTLDIFVDFRVTGA